MGEEALPCSFDELMESRVHVSARPNAAGGGAPPLFQQLKAEMRCPGSQSSPCRFSLSMPGEPVLLQKKRTHCYYCDPMLIYKLVNGKVRKDNFDNHLRKLGPTWRKAAEQRTPMQFITGRLGARRKECEGRGTDPCTFNHVKIGGPALAPHGWSRCFLCLAGNFQASSSVVEIECAALIYQRLREEDKAKLRAKLPGWLIEEMERRGALCQGTELKGSCSFSDDGNGNPRRVPLGDLRCVVCEADCKNKAGEKFNEREVVDVYNQFGDPKKNEIRQKFPSVDFDAAHVHKRFRLDGKYCTGADKDHPCVYSIINLGSRAKALPGKEQCIFCAPDLHSRMRDRKKRFDFLAKLRQLDSEKQEEVLSRLPTDVLIRQVRSRKVKAAWEDVLPFRRRAEGFDDEARERKAYRKQVLDDRRHAANKAGIHTERRRANESITNDSGMPVAASTERATNFARWCADGSWVMCEKCHSLQPRNLTEALLLDRSPDATMLPKKNCVYCRKYPNAKPPTVNDIPGPLQDLPHVVIEALRPVRVDTGKELRAHRTKHMRTDTALGYRAHTAMIRFHWKKITVRDQIKELDSPRRRQAELAYSYLKRQEESAYYEIVKMHNSFLRDNVDPSRLARKRRLDFIETVGLECAIWPHLFWKTDMCLTYVRSTDVRRLKRVKKKAKRRTDGHFTSTDDEEEKSEEDVEGDCHSIKRTYRALLLSPIIGYGSYEFLHFSYDLALWTALGAAKNVGGEKIPIRVMLQSFPFTSMYWKNVHNALIDLVRQIGPPKLFFTLSPFEWTFPYHKWILHDMAEMLKSRLFLPHGESLHQAHVMFQTIRGLVAGKQGGTWKKHSLCANKEDGSPIWIHYFTRMEFQDGTRKLPTQTYHGSGRPHIHVLLWSESLRDIPLDKIACATTHGQSEEMRGYIRGWQDDNRREAKWKVSNAANYWDDIAETWVLEHHKSDARQGRRAFFKEIMDALKCHQDLQYTDGYGALQRYVVGYVNKMNDAATDDMQDDNLEANQLALNILSKYRPMEPEMYLQMCQQRFRHWEVGTITRGRRNVVVPLPDAEPIKIPQFIRQYQNCAWAGRVEDGSRISLLHYLRKTNKKGGISKWLMAAHRKTGVDTPLETFAHDYNMRGEQIVAAAVYSRYNDKFFGQWIVLNIPFANIYDLYNEDITRQVPEDMKYFALALEAKDAGGYFWQNEVRVKKEMAQEGRSNRDMITFWRMILANTSLLADYKRRAISPPREIRQRIPVVLADGAGVRDLPKAAQPVKLNKEQRRLERHVLHCCRRSAQIRTMAVNQSDAGNLDELMLEAREDTAAICTGPPGTGKTTAIFSCIQEVIESNGKVLFALPTAQLSSRMKQVYKDNKKNVVIDTCAAAFDLMGNGVTELPTLADFDLIVVDEVSLLSKESFERIIKLWNHVDRTPALVFLGDDYQMGGYGERPWLSTQWSNSCYEYRLYEAYRCKDPDFWSMLKQIRRHEPSRDLVNDFCRGRKAWMGKPSVVEVGEVLRNHPETTIMSCTRKGASRVNFLATRALFCKEKSIATVDGDCESNHRNYEEGKLKKKTKMQPTYMPLYRGMKIYLTQNVRKEADFVNGMRCTVKAYCAMSRSIRVVTDTGRHLAIFKWTDPDNNFPPHYPIRPGYCSTIMKFQGATLKHVTIYLDCPGIKGAAYTALSRVATGNDYLLGGYLLPEHFTPADGRKK